LDQSLDLFMNGGPLEKMQWAMSKDSSGGSFGRFTDSLATYRVTGTLEEPQIGVAVAGNTAGDVEQKATRAGAGISQRVMKLGGEFGKIGERFKKREN
jgi:hypothetical protein